MADYPLGTTIYLFFSTRAFATGVPTTLGGTPVLSVLEENNATPITAGVSVQVDRASVTGLNQATIVATSGNGYESGKEYALYISTGTVSAVSVVGEVVGTFTIEKDSALRPTVVARTLDVSAAGEAGVDWANVGSPTTTVGLSNTTVGVLTTYTGNTVQSGDAFARIGAAGVSLSAIPDEAGVTTLLSRLTAGRATNLDSLDAAITSRATAAQILTTALTESYAADGIAPTLAQILFRVAQNLTEFAIAGTVLTVKKLDKVNTAETYTLDSDTSPTSRTRAT